MFFTQQGEHAQGWANLQAHILTTPDKLKDLRDKFNFANPASPQLDVVVHIALIHITLNLDLQITHRSECAVI